MRINAQHPLGPGEDARFRLIFGKCYFNLHLLEPKVWSRKIAETTVSHVRQPDQGARTPTNEARNQATAATVPSVTPKGLQDEGHTCTGTDAIGRAEVIQVISAVPLSANTREIIDLLFTGEAHCPESGRHMSTTPFVAAVIFPRQHRNYWSTS